MKIHFTASRRAAADLVRLTDIYGQSDLEDAEVVVPLGGDGWMLNTLRQTLQHRLPVFGMHRGNVGFLMNVYSADDLVSRLESAISTDVHPVLMKARTVGGDLRHHHAINEISLFRQTPKAARIRIDVDGNTRLDELCCDGVLVATPAGSTAYNLSAHGPILPLSARLLALTPICPFRPRRWRGALLRHDAEVVFGVHEADERGVSACADNVQVDDVVRVEVSEDSCCVLRLLFDATGSLDERILHEQFAT